MKMTSFRILVSRRNSLSQKKKRENKMSLIMVFGTDRLSEKGLFWVP